MVTDVASKTSYEAGKKRFLDAISAISPEIDLNRFSERCGVFLAMPEPLVKFFFALQFVASTSPHTQPKFDSHCAGGSSSVPRWIIDNDEPDLKKERDLDDDGDCVSDVRAWSPLSLP